MPRSPYTIEQLKAMAMLLGDGWWYDTEDHMFCLERGEYMMAENLDPDTMEPVYGPIPGVGNAAIYHARADKVTRGELGAADYPER
ncbi:hypothetical protein EVB41_036 [Rhizobium phage RHph_TM3_14A]|nr:hypothetical protein EVB29_036 [Rhizobium phage RHph_TM27A]QIG66956.1 hypothetical protein EVB30_036 [Rhizobium phage RHph_TM27B]QIG67045.1 hypothetical protein EVB31_035 [Rhizobium phage RHph_TM29]QIG67501.1 hypothetical protein EVB41_036 [Rhizobium phage RHph_TM3_14A]